MGTDSHDSLLVLPPESPGQVNHSLFLIKPPFASFLCVPCFCPLLVVLSRYSKIPRHSWRPHRLGGMQA